MQTYTCLRFQYTRELILKKELLIYFLVLKYFKKHHVLKITICFFLSDYPEYILSRIRKQFNSLGR